MNAIDFSPYFRSMIGYDRVFDLLDSATRNEETGWPPYNIEKLDDDTFRITMAVAGFNQDELSVVAHENVLTVAGKQKNADAQQAQFLYRGIAARSFERRFNLADYVRVTGANLTNGLLHVELKREVPEAMKPRSIAIQPGSTPKVTAIDSKAAQFTHTQ
jgi:molecular chaperone IbpA